MSQLEKLQALIAELARNPFYSAKVQIPWSLDQFFERAPFTLKRDLIEDQRAHPPYGTNLTYPIGRYTRFCQTSATTGKPLRWLDTPESWNWMLGCWGRVYQAAGVTFEDRIFFAFSFGPFLGFWTAFEAAAAMGCLAMPGGGMRSAARLTTMIDMRSTVLCCTPTYALRLAEVAAEESIDLAATGIRKIIVAGEPGGSIPGTRALIERLWMGARVIDHHGMTETGPVTYGCPKRPGVLHVMESEYIAEIVEPASGRPVPTGVTGELVLTNLGRVGSPLIRYRTGDLVQRAAVVECECGTADMALEGGILGRTDDMIVVRGVNLYPSAVEDVIRACDGVTEYRVEIRTDHALPQLTVIIEPSPECGDAAGLAHHVETALNSAFALRIAVTTAAAGELPRFEMKANRWIRVRGGETSP